MYVIIQFKSCYPVYFPKRCRYKNVILQLVLYEREMWCLTIFFENKGQDSI